MLKRNDDQLRVLLYSHDTVGLGHLRRNQAIACALAKSLPNPAILLVSGAWQGTMFDLPKCIDMVTIPAIMKAAHGGYVTRNSGLQTCDTMNLRSEIIRSVAESFQPDVFIVDKVPRGVYGELESSLESLRSGGRTLCVLGLRDILDEPEAVQMEWLRDQNEQAIARYYDAIWVYGDRQVFDLADEYRLEPTTRAKLTYTGYIDRRTGQESETKLDGDSAVLADESRPLHVCMVGGGEDGAPLASAFAQATLPANACGVIVCGPYMPAEIRNSLHRQAQGNSQLHVLEFLKRPEQLLARAERVVAMGGYNTVCELLSHDKPTLIVPRTTPRLEQLIRAERMQTLGLLEMLHPSDLTPAALSEWLHQPQRSACFRQEPVRLDGLHRIPQLLLSQVESQHERRVLTGHTGRPVRRPAPVSRAEALA